jgi:hypothetical protein
VIIPSEEGKKQGQCVRLVTTARSAGGPSAIVEIV